MNNHDRLDTSMNEQYTVSVPKITLEEMFRQLSEQYGWEQQHIPTQTISFPSCTGFIPSKIYVDEIKSYACQFRAFGVLLHNQWV